MVSSPAGTIETIPTYESNHPRAAAQPRTKHTGKGTSSLVPLSVTAGRALRSEVAHTPFVPAFATLVILSEAKDPNKAAITPEAARHSPDAACARHLQRRATHRQPPSRKAAKECSPGRKSGVSQSKGYRVPEGRQRLSPLTNRTIPAPPRSQDETHREGHEFARAAVRPRRTRFSACGGERPVRPRIFPAYLHCLKRTRKIVPLTEMLLE